MYFQRFYTESIAQAGFLIGCVASGEAVVIDPTRDLEPYLGVASRQGLKIVAITETHIHADYVSGSRELAQITGAKLYLSREGGPDWQYAFANEPNVELIGDGDEIVVGNVKLRASHTPGHTPEHLSFFVIDGAATDRPLGVLTGDFIFAGDVGRPDLLEVAAGFRDTMKQGAETLFDSIQKFKANPDWMTIWPGHGAGSACGKKLGGAPSTTLGYEKIVNQAIRCSEKSEFVDDILSGQPEPPKYFARMKTINKLGPAPTMGVWQISESEPKGQLVDVRARDEFLDGSLAGAVHIPMNASFSQWTGSLLSLDEPITIVANDESQAREAAKAMVLIGIENLSGWTRAESDVRIPVSAPQERREGTLLDIRTGAERAEDSIPDSMHIPLAYLADATNLPSGRIYVHCASGARSLVGASWLRSRGHEASPILADFEEVKKAELGRFAGQIV